MRSHDVMIALLDTIARELETTWSDSEKKSDLTVRVLDLSPLRLRFSSDVSCICISDDDVARLGMDTVLELTRQELVIRGERPGSAFILLDIPDQDGKFQSSFSVDPYWALVLDSGSIQRGLTDANPKRWLVDTIRHGVPLRFLSPYDPNQPVVGSNFYGRATEINSIMSHPDRSYAIIGGRRIGKTSLLKEIERRIRSQLPATSLDRIVKYDFWGYRNMDAFLSEVIRHFGDTPRLARGGLADYFPRFLHLKSRQLHGRIILILDEVDDLIEHDRAAGFELLGLLRRSAIAGDCRCLLAGFRLLARELYTFDTPLTFCQTMQLGNLTNAQARSMLVEPLQNMGVRLGPEVFPRVLNHSGGHPHLLQLFSQSLIELIDNESQDRREISLRDVAQVQEGGLIYERLFDNLIDNTNSLELGLACSLAGEANFDLVRMRDVAAANGVHLNPREIRDVCRNLEAIGVISREGLGVDTYHFSVPLQPAIASRVQGVLKMAWSSARREYRSRV